MWGPLKNDNDYDSHGSVVVWLSAWGERVRVVVPRDTLEAIVGTPTLAPSEHLARSYMDALDALARLLIETTGPNDGRGYVMTLDWVSLRLD